MRYLAGLCLVVGLFWAGDEFGHAADKPVVYDHVTPEGAGVDELVNHALEGKYTILPVVDSPDYVNPQVAAGSMPETARTASGEILSGYVLLGYVVTAEGNVSDVTILKSTDERLNATALKATESWHFTPATLKGAPIATTAAQEFNFRDPAKGFVTTGIVLYQTNEVLQQRVPDTTLLAAYLKQLQAILTGTFANDKTPETFHVVVAVRPGKQARVWFVASKQAVDSAELAALRAKLEAVTPVEVTGGPVALAISGTLAGGDGAGKPDAREFQPPVPKAWQDAVKTKLTPQTVDATLDAVWPAGK